MLHHDDPNSGPCPHMENLLNQTADGSARGLGRWYAVAHAARCGRCARFLAALRALLPRLKQVKTEEPSEETLQRMARKFSSEVEH